MEAIKVTITNGVKDGMPSVLYKQGRKLLGWTQRWDSDGLWHNHRNGYSFSASDTEERAGLVMKEYLEDVLDPFGTKCVEFETK